MTTSPNPPSFIDAARIEWKLGRYGVANAIALRDPEPWHRAQDYRRAAAARMVPIDRKDLRGRLPAGEYHLSRKVDGEFTVLIFRDGAAATVNPGGTVRVGLPMLDEAAERLRQAGVRSALFAGELYYRRPDGGRERVHDVSRAARAPASQEDLDNLHYVVFDLIELDGQQAPNRFGDTFARIEGLFGGGRRVRPVDFAPAHVKTIEEVERHFQEWVDLGGGEGVVLRSDSSGRFKVKPRHTLDVAVVGFTESGDDRQGMLHDVLVAVMRRDGSFHVLGHVGTGFSDEVRRSFLSDLKDRVVRSDFIEPGPDHVAYQMVRPDWVIEISCLDMVTHTTRGSTVDRMVIHWDAAAGKYAPLGRLPLCSLVSPVFLRHRDDKRVNATDVRLAQISDLVEIARADVNIQATSLPASQVLRREVYTKAQKGQTMVRKLLMWQTNKLPEDGYPAYVVHLTDFSPTRKEPLQREIRVSNSREQIEALWADLHKEYVVRGWSPA